MTRFIFIRHGHSESNQARTFTGQIDVELSETGLLQTERVSSAVIKRFSVDAVYSSDLIRAVHTVEKIAKHFSLPVHACRELREIDGGAWEGLTFDEIHEKFTDEHELWLKDIAKCVPRGGESALEVQVRVFEKIKEIAKNEDGKTVVVATHAYALRTQQMLWEGRPIEDMQKVGFLKNASISVINYENGKFFPETIGETAHLEGLETGLPKNI